ncbi:hypothetical protein BC831DRAFT_463218, partial [Entophlyctis helioformis]
VSPQCAAGPNITVTTAPPIVFALGNARINRTVPYTAAPVCSPSNTLACSISIINSTSAITAVTSQLLQLDPSSAIGLYQASVSCSESHSGSTYTASSPFDFFVVRNALLTVSSQRLAPSIPDCIPTRVTADMLETEFSGGVTAWMVGFTPSTSSDGDAIVRNVTLPWPASYAFTQQDIYDSLVSISPALLTSVATSRPMSVPFSARDPTGNLVYGTVAATINYAFCPMPTSSQTSITSYNGVPVVLTTDALPLREPHGLSVWNVAWRLPFVAAGILEYYCSDPECAGNPWLPVPTYFGSTFLQGWVIMNALRWNPNGYTGPSFIINFSTVESYPPGTPAVIALNVSVVTNNPNPPLQTLTPPPYSKCVPITLGATSATGSASLPFGPFVVSSPIRPMCAAAYISAAPVAVGDVLLSSILDGRVYISGHVKLGSVVLPQGFVPLAFTGRNSSVGTIQSAVRITTEPSDLIFGFRSPQVDFPPDQHVRSRTDLSVLQYDPTTGAIAHISASAWTQAIEPARNASLWTLSVTLPGSGIYIFGYLDNAANRRLPAAFGTWIEYQADWGTKTLLFDEGKLALEVRAASNARFALQQPSLLTQWSPDGYTIKYAVYITSTATADYSVRMTYTSKDISRNAVWGYLDESMASPIQGVWTFNTSSTTYNSSTGAGWTANITTTRLGMWAVAEKGLAISPARRAKPKFSVQLMLPLITCIVLWAL